jgi:hypothetical protein
MVARMSADAHLDTVAFPDLAEAASFVPVFVG